ncbi:IS1 ORF [Shigella sonnei]|nr:IS1 ORF [Shigella sonnei]
MPGNCTHYGRWPQHDFTSLKKLRPQSVTSRIQPGSDVIVCAEMDEQWGYVGAKSRQRWLFYAGWPLYESPLSFSKSVELHDKVIGHYLNIKHYQ